MTPRSMRKIIFVGGSQDGLTEEVPSDMPLPDEFTAERKITSTLLDDDGKPIEEDSTEDVIWEEIYLLEDRAKGIYKFFKRNE